MNLNHLKSNFKNEKVHFIGIGGIGMSALARYFYGFGSIVSGSDKEQSSLINELTNEGINNIWTPHSDRLIGDIDPDYIIYSTAITDSNEELNWAKAKNKMILHRSELLALATSSRKSIIISGTHGKTTTTALISEMLINSDFDPSIIIGGILVCKNTNAIAGKGDYFIVEGDESDKSFLKGNPDIAVITNIEADHLENYPGGFDEIKKSFIEFGKKGLAKNGLVICSDDKVASSLIDENFGANNSKLTFYGLNPSAQIRAVQNKNTKLWDIYSNNELTISVKPRLPGSHNILNALATFAVGQLIGVPLEKIKYTIENYSGVKRRFQIITQANGITVIDDYAHHPTEISATIKSAKELNPKRLIAVLQPHQPLRLRDLWYEFKKALSSEKDFPIFVTDTYIARGKPIEGISSKKLVEEVGNSNISYLSGSIEEIAAKLKTNIKSGDLVLIMGAGDITNLKNLL